MHQVSNYVKDLHKWDKDKRTWVIIRKVNKTFISKGSYFSCISFKNNKCIFYHLRRKKKVRKYKIRNVNKYRTSLISEINFSGLNIQSKKLIRGIILNKIRKHGYQKEWQGIL
jgi:hypothetical protein